MEIIANWLVDERINKVPISNEWQTKMCLFLIYVLIIEQANIDGC